MASPETYVSGVIPAGKHPIEAEHKLVSLVVVGEEARSAEPVDLAEAERLALAGAAVDDVRVRAWDPEHARAVQEQVRQQARATLQLPGLKKPDASAYGTTRFQYEPIRVALSCW